MWQTLVGSVVGKKYFFFKNEPVEKKGTKKRKMVPESSEDHLTEEGDAQKKVSKKKTHKKKFFEDVLAGAEKYRRSYRELGDRQRVERVEQLAKNVMSACINQKGARDSDEQFIKNNEELQMDILTFLGKYFYFIIIIYYINNFVILQCYFFI